MSTKQDLQEIVELAEQLIMGQAEAEVYGESWITQAETEANQSRSATDAFYQKTIRQAQIAYGQAMTQAQNVHDKTISGVKQKRDASLTATLAAYRDQLQKVQSQAKSVWDDSGLLSADWTSAGWAAWKPGQSTAVARLPLNENGLRIGRLTEQGIWDTISLPALVPFIGYRSLLLKTKTAARPTAVKSTHSLLLRLLAAVPPGKLRFTFIDPVGLGQNVAPFLHLADYDDDLVTSRAWTEPNHIDQRLAELTEHMETVIQKYLRNQYASIEEYNQKAGEVAEAYRVLVVHDFPTNFSEQAARRLVSIMQNGPRCGVYMVVLVDMDKPLPHGFNLADLDQNATVIAWDGKRFVWQDEDFKDCLLELDGAPPAELMDRIVKNVGAAAKDSNKVEVPFERIVPAAHDRWMGQADSGLSVPLGPSGARTFQHFTLGQGTAIHALVAGKTGSGKSTLLHILITNLALKYSPTEVELYLIDFKKGVEFKTYATHALPHARVIAIESEREFGLSVLQGLDAELKRRGDLFRSAGVDNLAAFRAGMSASAGAVPRILLVVDEFQEFFSDDDSTAHESGQFLDRLVRQGRAFGIHVLLGSQTLAGSYSLARSTIDQMAVRIALQCSEADSRLILADDNGAARLLSRPGEAIYNDANGRVEGNNPFQVAWLTDAEQKSYLGQVRDLAQARGYRPPRPQIVFEGNAPAHVEQNQLLTDLLTAPQWPEADRRVAAWMGEPIAISDPTAANFRRQTGSNLLAVGQSDESALAMLGTTLISLAAQHTLESARFFIIDFSPVDADHATFLEQMSQRLPHPVRWGRRRELPDLINEVAGLVSARMETDYGALAQQPAVYLFIYGLQRARDLRPDESMGYSSFSYGEEEEALPPSPAKQFPTILQEGPDMGVHTIVWCDTMTNLNRTLDRRGLREFEMRVAFQMGGEDSAMLIDTPAASKLGPYRALFVSEEEGRTEKFRPYNLPTADWLDQALTHLSTRT